MSNRDDVKGPVSGIDADAGIGSSAEELETHNPDIDDYDEVIKLIDDDEDEASGETETTDESESDDETEVDEGESKEEPKTVPYERFSEVNQKMRDYEKSLSERESAIARLEGRLELMEKLFKDKGEPEDTPQPTSLPLDDILGSEDPQEILDAFQENPAKFLNDYAQRVNMVNRQRAEEERAEREYYSNLQGALEKFGAENEGFHTNIDELVGIVNEKPHHNVVSAYYEKFTIPALKAELEAKGKDLDAQIEAAKKEGFKEGRKKTIEEIRAKGNASLLDGSESTGKVTPEPELQDLDGDRGKLISHLTQKLIQKRSAK